MDGFLVGLTWPIIFPLIPFIGIEHFFKLENGLKENDEKYVFNNHQYNFVVKLCNYFNVKKLL